MCINVITFPITALFMNINHVTRASGYPRKAMNTLVFSVILNTCLAPLFIHYLDMGMKGAAIATCLSQFIGLLSLIPHYLNKSNVLYLKRGIYAIKLSIIKRICLIGLPPCLLNISGCIVVAYLNHQFLVYEGDLGVAAYGIVNRFTFIFFMVAMGISHGLQPIVGYNHGLGYYDRVRAALCRAMAAAACATTLGFIFAQAVPESVISLFVDQDDAQSANLIAIGSSGMRIFTIFMPIIGAQMIIGNFFQSIGKPVISVILNLLRQIIILIPTLYILPRYYGTDGIWYAVAVSDIAAAVACWSALFIYLRRNHKQQDPRLH